MPIAAPVPPPTNAPRRQPDCTTKWASCHRSCQASRDGPGRDAGGESHDILPHMARTVGIIFRLVVVENFDHWSRIGHVMHGNKRFTALRRFLDEKIAGLCASMTYGLAARLARLLAVHHHDDLNIGVSNAEIVQSLHSGIRIFPFRKGATDNA